MLQLRVGKGGGERREGEEECEKGRRGGGETSEEEGGEGKGVEKRRNKVLKSPQKKHL